jgi:anti-sigma-K factor RskA
VNLLRHDLHILTGAYALDALEHAEQERFEHHLQRCQPCSHEVRDLHETATQLALAVAEAPPPQLRERVLAAVTRTRQLPPATDQRPVPKPRSVWLPRLAAAAAAVAAVVAIVLGVTQSATQSKLDRVQAQEQAIAAVLNAPDVRIASHRTSVGGTATVVFSEVSHKMMVTTAGLPPLPASKVYQLWLIAPGNIRSAGLLPAPTGGRTAPVLTAGLAAGDQAGVTVEPAGGSRQPTTTPIIAIPLAG